MTDAVGFISPLIPSARQLHFLLFARVVPAQQRRGGGSVVVAAGEDDERLVSDFIHEAVFVVDAAGPAAFQFVFERLRFADAAKRVAHRFDDQAGQAFKEFGIARAAQSV